jgi:hypothetical protein
LKRNESQNPTTVVRFKELCVGSNKWILVRDWNKKENNEKTGVSFFIKRERESSERESALWSIFQRFLSLS